MTDLKNEVKSTCEEANREFVDRLTKDQQNTLKRLNDVQTRISILNRYQESMKEMIDDNIFDNSPLSLGITISVLEDWMKELQEERQKLLKDASIIVANICVADSYTSMTNAVKEKFTIEDIASKHITKAFLTNMFGEDDTPGKLAVQDICNNAVKFFIQTILDGSMAKDFGV